MRKLFVKDKDGQSVIEFALVLPILLLVLFGITEFGRAIRVTSILNSAAREGAIWAADTLKARDKAEEVLDAAGVNAKSIIIDYPAEETVRVTVTSDFEVLSGGILDPFMGTIELKGRTVMRLLGD